MYNGGYILCTSNSFCLHIKHIMYNGKKKFQRHFFFYRHSIASKFVFDFMKIKREKPSFILLMLTIYP